MGHKLEEGNGECLVHLGFSEDGQCLDLSKDKFEADLEGFRIAFSRLSCNLIQLQKQENSAWLMARRIPESLQGVPEVRVAVVGNVDAGKSTMLGVLTKGVLDDGRGKARINLFRHKHELDSGRTSSIGCEILGFDGKGQPITSTDLSSSGVVRLSWEQVCSRAHKIINFLDLAGHEKYLKTTMFGLTGCAPDYSMLMVGANAGMIGMAREHLSISFALNVPVLVVITKIDMCPANVLEETMRQLNKVSISLLNIILSLFRF